MANSLLPFLLGTIAGVVLGAVIVWFALRSRASEPAAGENRVEGELRAQIDTLRSDLAKANSGRLEAEKALSSAAAQVTSAERRMEDARVSAQAQIAAQKEDQARQFTQMREAFNSLSSEALARLQPQFLALANETLSKHAETAKGDLSARQESISSMLKPIEEIMKMHQERLAQSETAHASSIGEVTRHLEMLAQQSTNLSGETLQLRRVLGASQARGRWGEETLRRVLESSGMSVHCDFSEQAQSDDKKPDVLIKLPGDRVIIIDSKFPDTDFLGALNTGDEAKRAELLKIHADKMRATIKALADRDYPAQFPNSLDHVVLFVPAESIFSAALEGDRDLIIWAAQRRIMLATPTSLIALLRSVSVTWQQHDQAVNAREIAGAAEELFSRVSVFIKHFDSIRGGLAKANDAYNDAVGSYERSVRPQGERVIKLGASNAGKQLAEPALLTDSLRGVPAPRSV